MRTRMIAVVLILSFSLGVGAVWARLNFNPGKWEILTETTMTGSGGNMTAPSQTHIQCITEADLVPQSEEASNECQVTDIQQSGNTVSWKIICSGQGGQMKGTGQITYQGNSMHGTMDMEITGAGMHVKNIIKGRRIGPCDSNTASQQTPSAQKNVLAEDAKDVGKAAKNEAKQSTIDEVRQGVRGLFKKVFN